MREVLSKYPDDHDKSKLVLKDIDFLNEEKQLYIEENKKTELFETLKKDSQFF